MRAVIFCLGLFLAATQGLGQQAKEDVNVPSLDTMTKYTIYSYAAYCGPQLSNWTCYWCNQQTSLVPAVKVETIFANDGHYGTYGYVGASSKEILVSFRGSKTLNNWLHDLDFLQTSYPSLLGGEVHRGFYESYTVVADTIRSAVKKLVAEHPDLPVTVTGHSLGAAISVLCATDLVETNIANSQISVINFGEPRVGNLVFANYFNKIIPASYRVVNMRDLVPHVPPSALNFHHVSTEIWFPTNATTFVVCDGSGEDANCSDSLVYFDIADHLTYLGINFHAGKNC
eukprot:TRINITY_DN16707_c0_g1_i1.p1 TRINITY_DN16707_c0_g1~~TRINITY_DN16707_c0_g1_i1.p1  ORF type:complete len:286 (+),score=38.59 TRINITY_DN16707_c0_g1_i1:26-883(+)